MAFVQSEIFEDEFPLVRSCPALNEIRLAEEIKDLTIEVQDGAVLHAHRIILAARIPSLRKTLSGLRREQNPLLRWPTVPLSVATVFVNYVYTGQVELTQANVRDVVMFARIVKLPVLENWGHNFMANRVNFENLRTIWDFASSLCIDLLKEKCLSLMRQRFEEFIASDLFLRMPADTVPCPFNVRPRQTQAPQTNFFLFGEDKDDRSRGTVLRYNPRQQRAERVADMEARQWATISVVGESVFMVGGSTSLQDYSKCVVEFLVQEARWRERAPLAVGRSSHAAAVVKTVGGGEGRTLLGVFGGENEKGRLSSCEVYDVSRDRWFKLPDMREKRNVPAAACLPGDSRVFVFGGWEGSCLASVEFCRLEADWEKATATSARTADFWQAAAPMRTARWAPAATPFRGRIIVAGGWNRQGSLNGVEMFTPPDASSPLGQWTKLARMKQRRAFFTLLTSTDAVFALGNAFWDARNSVETLTPPATSADSGNDLTSWVWSSKDPVETLDQIWGAASILL